MSSLADHHASTIVKMLLVGNSGSGKTAALASLAKAGFRLWIADFDNGLDILKAVLKDDAAALGRVDYEMFVDHIRANPSPAGVPLLTGPSQYNRFVGCLAKWPGLGKNIDTLGPNDIFVIDSLTMLGEAAMRFVAQVNGRNGVQPWQSDWGAAIKLQESVLQILYDKAIKCNVIITSHLTATREGKDEKGEAVMSENLYPSALGNKLPPKVGRYFNAMLLVRRTGASRQIVTVPTETVDIKTSLVPKAIPNTLNIDDGLVKFFAACGVVPSSVPSLTVVR